MNMANKTINIFENVEMPVIGFGTWQTDRSDTEGLKSAMEEAFNCGYRHFDTAYLYDNENIVGEVINGWISKGLVKREELFITTKLPSIGVLPDRVEFFLNISLNNLRLNYVDLYLVHYPVCPRFNEMDDSTLTQKAAQLPTESSDHKAVWKKMEELMDSGKVRSIGLSNFNQSQITKILNTARIKPANLQIEIHVYFQNPEIVDFCRRNGISVVAYAPLCCPAFNESNEQVGLATRQVPNMLTNTVVVGIAKKHSKTPSQILLRYLIERRLAAIPEGTNHAIIKENIDIFDFQLDSKDMSELTTIERGRTSNIVDYERRKGLTDHPEDP